MIKRIISCIVSTVIVLGATIAYDRTPACRIAVMEQVPTQLASVLPRAASYELELRTEEGNRSYTVNCHDKDGNTFRSYTMQTVEGQEEPLNFTYTDYTYDENGNCADAITTDKTNNSTLEYRRSYDDKNRVLRTENYEDGELSASSETVYTEVDNGQSSAVNTVYDADGNELMVVRMGMNTKMIVTGDMTQIDLPSSQTSGLVQALKILKGVKGISFVELNKKDIVRHKLVTQIVEAYEKFDKEAKAERERRKAEQADSKIEQKQ